MREILFRGKRVDNGKWIEGSLSTEYYKECCCVMVSPTSDDCFKVDPETVGQYTGLTDKNGIRIFEGDILSGHLDDLFPKEESRYEVVWHDYGWHIKNDSGIDTANTKWVMLFFEVIGNIHDNPELLEG
jgi:uncharacterized phage protein (TIGR01671 family)